MAHPTSAARPKRAGEDFARTHDQTRNKKPRFDQRNPSTLAPDAGADGEEDLILDADVIGKSGAQTKRNAVNIDGYESDSDNDNFDARAAERERAAKGGRAGAGAGVESRDADEDDMFADLERDVQGTADGDEDEDEGLGREGKKRDKAVRFLEQSQIEGQVQHSRSGGHVSSRLLAGGGGGGGGREGKRRAGSVSSSSSSGDEEARDELPGEVGEVDEELARELGAGGKKKHAPRLDAFNLRDEQDEGRFDESGNYVRKAADPDAVNDRWLDGLSKRDVKRAREAEERREQERRRKAVEGDAVLARDLLSTLIRLLEVGESPLEALQRLNRGKAARPREGKLPKWKLKRLNKMDVDEPGDDGSGGGGGAAGDPAEAARRSAVEAITGAADALYSRGQHDIYEAEREVLMRQFTRETGEEWKASAAAQGSAAAEAPSNGDVNDTWEYRWSDARDGGEHHGPYDGSTMKAWDAAGYFGEGVEFRRIGEGEWSRLLDVR